MRQFPAGKVCVQHTHTHHTHTYTAHTHIHTAHTHTVHRAHKLRSRVTAAINSSQKYLTIALLLPSSLSFLPLPQPAVGVRQKSFNVVAVAAAAAASVAAVVVFVAGQLFAYEMRAVNCICALLRYTQCRAGGGSFNPCLWLATLIPRPLHHQHHPSVCVCARFFGGFVKFARNWLPQQR